MTTLQTRCFGTGQDFYEKYHDEEWGVPVHDDQHLFEMLCLEGAQAGLNWAIILKRREGYRKLFYSFDPKNVADMTDEELYENLKNPAIIRNRLKVFSVRKNARAFLDIQKEFGSFAHYLWAFVDHKPIVNYHETYDKVPCHSSLSDKISKDLKKRGMSFVGSTIIYSFLQAVGVINDHLISCPCHAKCLA